MARARATVEDSAEQRKKDARRRARTEKSRLAKVSPKKGVTDTFLDVTDFIKSIPKKISGWPPVGSRKKK